MTSLVGSPWLPPQLSLSGTLGKLTPPPNNVFLPSVEQQRHPPTHTCKAAPLTKFMSGTYFIVWQLETDLCWHPSNITNKRTTRILCANKVQTMFLLNNLTVLSDKFLVWTELIVSSLILKSVSKEQKLHITKVLLQL